MRGLQPSLLHDLARWQRFIAVVGSPLEEAEPVVAARMTKLIQGIGTVATITTVSQKAVGEYGLDALGYSFRPGTPAEWTGA